MNLAFLKVQVLLEHGIRGPDQTIWSWADRCWSVDPWLEPFGLSISVHRGITPWISERFPFE